QDVFILPTRSEGFPVALVEAMSAGLVPIVSDIESGVPEVVDGTTTGLTPPVADVPAFAAALEALVGDRSRVEAMSAAARAQVVTRFEIGARVQAYQDLYARWRELYRPVAGIEHLTYGSRLDQPWIPNTLVRTIRPARKAWQKRRATRVRRKENTR